MDSIKRICIVGGGLSGALLAIQLIRNAKSALEIILVSSEAEIGRGLAYQNDSDNFLLNVPAFNMSLFPDEPNHFLDWLQRRQPEAHRLTFASRNVYGDYIQETLKQTVATSAPNITFQPISQTVVDLDKTENGFILTLANGKIVETEQVALATGNVPATFPAVFEENATGKPYFLSPPLRLPKNLSFNSKNNILFIGCGLTAIDLIVYFTEKNWEGNIYAVSRNGFLPAEHHFPETASTFRFAEPLPQDLLSLLLLVRKTIKENGTQNWRQVLDALRPFHQTLWQNFTENEKRVFLNRLNKFWNVARHRIPPQTADLIKKWQSEGRFQVLAGSVLGWHLENQTATVKVKTRGGETLFLPNIEAVINCTGTEQNIEKWKAPLYQNALQKGKLRADALKLGIDSLPNGTVLNAEGQPVHGLWVLGPLQKGILFEITAAPEIRKQAQDLAQNLLKP